jgi:hypothetical protein
VQENKQFPIFSTGVCKLSETRSPGRRFFCTLSLNIFGSSVWTMRPVSILRPRIWTWGLDVCKICTPLGESSFDAAVSSLDDTSASNCKMKGELEMI